MGGLGRGKAFGLQVKELLLDSLLFALLGFVERGVGAHKGRLRRHHQPTLGHTVMAQLKRLIAGLVVKRLPGVPLERLVDDLRHQLEGSWNTGDKAKLCKMGGIVLMVEFGIGDEIPGLVVVLKALINASARSWNTPLSEAFPSQLLLTKGTPPF